MTRSVANQLADYERQYRALAAQLADIGYICAGSLARRHNRCGKPNCRCHDEPPQMHGPYWQWTAKVNGKTVNRRFNETQAALSKMDRQRPATTRRHHSNATHRSQSHRTHHPRSQTEGQGLIAVSYTHLTLPTNREV